MYQYINKIVTIIFVHNWIAILYFNFKKLPFKQAIKLPFDFYYKVRFKNLKGKIIIKNENIHRGMIKIGGRGSEMFPRNPVIIDISGTWIIIRYYRSWHRKLYTRSFIRNTNNRK